MIRVEPRPPLRQTLRVDIVEFLTARLDEDERYAVAVPYVRTGGARWVAEDGEVYEVIDLNSPGRCDQHPAGRPNMCDDLRVVGMNDDVINADIQYADHIARHDPARVLADVAAKREILRELTLNEPRPGDENTVEYLLELLAQPYTDHPDFDPAWKVGE